MPMTPEERERYDRIDRQLEFLAAHQAQLSSDLTTLKQIAAKHDEQITRLEQQTTQHGEQIILQTEQIAKQGEHIQFLTDNMLRLARVVEERDRQTNEKFAVVNERLGVLMNVVERYFSNGGH